MSVRDSGDRPGSAVGACVGMESLPVRAWRDAVHGMPVQPSTLRQIQSVFAIGAMQGSASRSPSRSRGSRRRRRTTARSPARERLTGGVSLLPTGPPITRGSTRLPLPPLCQVSNGRAAPRSLGASAIPPATPVVSVEQPCPSVSKHPAAHDGGVARYIRCCDKLPRSRSSSPYTSPNRLPP